MKQCSCLSGAPEVFSKSSGELDQSLDPQANGLAYLHIPEMICMPNFWKGGEGIALSFLVPIFLLVLRASEGRRTQLRLLESGYSC